MTVRGGGGGPSHTTATTTTTAACCLLLATCCLLLSLMHRTARRASHLICAFCLACGWLCDRPPAPGALRKTLERGGCGADGLSWRDTSTLRLGEAVTVLASPFGALSPSIFLNSVSTGVVSNFVRRSGSHGGVQAGGGANSPSERGVSLILTDARCLPCTEGGPVVDSEGRLLGVALPPLQQKNGAAVGYGLVAPMACVEPFLRACSIYGYGSSDGSSGGGGGGGGGSTAPQRRRVVKMLRGSLTAAAAAAAAKTLPPLPRAAAAAPVVASPCISADLSAATLERAGRSLVMVCVGSSWASGILISTRGHILTNAHVFHTGANAKSSASRDKKNYPPVHVWLQLGGPQQREGGDGVGDPLSRPSPTQSAPVQCRATIVYKSDGPLDVALLQAVVPSPDQATVQPIDLDASFRACVRRFRLP
eukprot:SAG25_NODE_62_length_17948_cov_8.453975_7_plen_422_part_00